MYVFVKSVLYFYFMNVFHIIKGLCISFKTW